MKSQRVEFDPPEGLSIPADGEDFDVVCTLRKKGNRLCLVRVGDSPMPGYGPNDKPAPASHEEMGAKIMEAMPEEYKEPG